VAFLVTSLVIVALPGTGALITLSAGVSHGARAGVVAAFGCTLGIVPHLVAAVTGTAALLRAGGIAAAAARRHVVERPHVVRRVLAASFVGLGIRLATTSR
jgi:threonine/homoserine/homoserine lactone efflux protein